MKILKEKTLLDLQSDFSSKFPGLQIQFYRGAYENGRPSPPEDQLHPSVTIGNVPGFRQEGEVSTDGHLKVATFEKQLWDSFGLNAQVFRRSGNIWLQTSATDQWTLAEQNRKGEHSVDAYQEMHPED
ncbi:MAG: hypothetical protein RLY31_1516 [Bacteroidota bacterium]|jgi:hypothetical protein